VLGELYPPGAPARGLAPAATIERIQQLTAEEFGITPDDLVSHSRRAAVTWPRQIAMYLAREHTGQTLPAIAARFGGRNHTTVLHAWRHTNARIASEPEVFEVVRRLTDRLSATEADRRA
jgi:chromosomal replication initiator protein